MKRQTLLATLNAALREASEKLAQSDLVLMRMRRELAIFKDILQRAEESAARGECQYENAAGGDPQSRSSGGKSPSSDPPRKRTNPLGLDGAGTQDEEIAANELVRKYREQVRAAELRIDRHESDRRCMQKAVDDLTWQIKKLSARD